MPGYVFFDLERSSSYTESTEILEIAAYKEGAPPFRAFLKVDEVPGASDELWKLVGFSRNEYLANAREPKEVLKAFVAYVDGLPVAGHNVLAYDVPVLERALANLGLPKLQSSVLDTLRLAHLVFPTPPDALSSYRLEDMEIARHGDSLRIFLHAILPADGKIALRFVSRERVIHKDLPASRDGEYIATLRLKPFEHGHVEITLKPGGPTEKRSVAPTIDWPSVLRRGAGLGAFS